MKVSGYVLITSPSKKLIGVSGSGYYTMDKRDFSLFFSQDQVFAHQSAIEAETDVGEEVKEHKCDIVIDGV